MPCLLKVVAAPFLFVFGTVSFAANATRDDVTSMSVAELRVELDAGRTTSVEIVRKLTARIESLDRKGPEIRSIIALNPDALSIARALDRERKEKKIRGPLHGIPVLLKDN